MITDELLLEKGYKKFDDDYKYADCLFQKRIRNDKGYTKYFITFYKYTHDYSETNYEVNLQFEKEKYMMNIKLFCIEKNMTIEEIEREIYAIWYGLDCKYYDCEAE